MRILLANAFQSRLRFQASGGMERCLWYLREGLARRYEVNVVCREAADIAGISRVTVLGPTIAENSSILLREHLVSDYCDRIIARSDEYDCVVAFNLPHIMPQLTKPAVCLFFNEHREWLPAGPPKPGQVFAFPAQWMRNTFLKATDLDPARCLTIPMGIDLRAFSPRRITGRRNDKVTLLFSSVWHPGKGIEEFLETCSMLNSHSVNFRALLTGSAKLWDFGDQQERVFSEAERNRIESLVRRAENQLPQLKVLGEVPHTRMPKIFRSADLLVVPSRWLECLPLVVIEAMASGTPALSVASGGLPELIVDGTTGYLVHTPSASVMTDAVERLIKNGGVSEEMRRNVRKAVRHLSWSRVISRLERAISLAQRNCA